jgi:TonB-dependent receptor
MGNGWLLINSIPDDEAGATVLRDINLPATSGEAGPGKEGDIVRMSEFVVATSREMEGAAIAINEQRFAPNIMNVVAADEFGSVAEGNVGEFMKFLPGITIGYVGGETRSVSMGGVPSNYVPVTLGGFDLSSAASSTTGRQIEFEQVSINSLARIEILHSPTPESPGAALAGSVNMVPRSAFERERALFTGRAFIMMRSDDWNLGSHPGSLKSPSRETFPGMEFSYIAPVNKRFGFTLSGGTSTSYLRQDTVQNRWAGAGFVTNGAALPDTTSDKPYLYQVLAKDDPKVTQRSSVGATVDYKLTTNDRVRLSFQYSYFDTKFGGGTLTFLPTRVSAGNFSSTFTHGVAGAGEVRDEAGARRKTGTTYMPTLSYRHNGPLWKAEAGAGLSHTTNYYTNVSEGSWGNIMARHTGVTISFDEISSLRPGQIAVTEGTTGAPIDITNLNSYVLNQATANEAQTNDLKRSAYANLRRDLYLAGAPISVKGGLDVRHARRDLRGSSPTWTYLGPDGRASTTPIAAGSDDNAGALGVLGDNFSKRTLPFGFPRVQWVANDKLWDFYKAHPTYFQVDANGDYRNRVTRSKLADEVVSSAYLRGDLSFLKNRLKLVGGLRAEQTDITAEGPLTDPTRNYQRDASGKILRATNGSPLLKVPTTDALGVSQLTFLSRGQHADKEYLRLFPSLNASFNVPDNLIARFAYYRSLGRPDFDQYTGGITLPDLSAAASTTNRITVNNAGIKAWSADSYKVRLEYYFERVGQVSIGGFVRDFTNFLGNAVIPAAPEFLTLYDLDPGTYGNYDVSTQYNIASTVRMTGLEFDYKQALTFLPQWARGLQVFGNASAVRATGEAASEFSGYTPRAANVGISLSRAQFNVKVNWNYRSRQRQDAITGRGIEPGTYIWAPPLRFLDVQGEYYLARRVAVFASLRNLRNTPTTVLERHGPSTPAAARLYQLTKDGASLWTFGVKGEF